MKLVDPFALIFLISIPAIILMYLLKQTFEVKEVSSTYLWEQVLKDIEVNAPWQKLKRNILLLLQLVIALLIVFSMAKPFFILKGKAFDNVILVIDNSGSMNAKYNEKTKLDEAKQRAEKLIKSLKAGSKITLITCGKDTKVELSAVTDKTIAIAKIKDIEKSDFSGDIHDSLSLVKSISKQYQNYKAVFYTDESMVLKDINGEVQNIYYPSDNVSLDYISQVKDKGGFKALVRINNRSNKSEKREICLYGDDKILDIKNVNLASGEIKTVYFDGISEKVSYLKAEISEKDGLLEDNDIYSVIESQGIKKVLLVSNKNVFIEKALSNIKGIELYKANSADTNINGYDLYIFDGIYPKQLPSSGSILAINPTKENLIVKAKGIIKGGQGMFLKNAITNYIGGAQINVAELGDLELPYWGDSLIEVDKKSAAFAGDDKGRKIGVIAFDLHKSDFPLI